MAVIGKVLWRSALASALFFGAPLFPRKVHVRSDIAQDSPATRLTSETIYTQVDVHYGTLFDILWAQYRGGPFDPTPTPALKQLWAAVRRRVGGNDVRLPLWITDL